MVIQFQELIIIIIGVNEFRICRLDFPEGIGIGKGDVFLLVQVGNNGPDLLNVEPQVDHI